jgi:hypothetical protein
MDSWPSPTDANVGKAYNIEVESTICRSAAPEGSAHEPEETAGECSFSPLVSIEAWGARQHLHARYPTFYGQPPRVTALSPSPIQMLPVPTLEEGVGGDDV